MAVRIKAVWEKLMGKTIAGHTLKIQLRNKKLFLHFDSPALKEELSYSKQKVIQMINEEFGEEVVREIIY